MDERSGPDGDLADRGPWFELAERYGLFVPVGLVVSVARAVPGSVDELADRGRAEVTHLVERVEMKVRTARVIGQFAAPRVRRAITDRIDQQRAARRAATRTRPGGERPAGPEASDAGSSTTADVVGSVDAVDVIVAVDVIGSAEPADAPDAPDAVGDAVAAPDAVGAAEAVAGAEAAVDLTAGELPIDGYDQLGASQIVARLDGLAPVELEAVRRYELANRHRRTILTRIQQLSTDR
jgi:hypothetical protein